MARLALTVVGAVAGFFIGGPFGAQIGAMLGGMAGSMLFGPTIKGPRLEDLSVTASTYGQVIPELYGTSRMGGNLIWTAGIKETKKKSGGGKGGPKQVNYSYSASFAIGLCKGVITDMMRVWADGKLLSGEKPISFSNMEFAQQFALALGSGKTKRKYKFRVYKGTEDQTPDSVIVAKEGAGNVPGYRGLAYIVFEDMPLEDFGNRIPQITVEVSKSLNRTFPLTQPIPATGETFVSDGTYPIDWDGGRFYTYSGSTLTTYDALTMKEVRRVTLGATEFSGSGSSHTKWNVIPGSPYIIDEIASAGNCRPIGIWDTRTGAYLGRIGRVATVLGDWPGGSHGGPYSPILANTAGGGTTFGFRVLTKSGQENYFVAMGGVSGRFVIYRVPDRAWVFQQTMPNNQYWMWVRGKEVVGKSEIIGFRNVGSNIRINILGIPAGSTGFETDPPSIGQPWVYHNALGVTSEIRDINPFQNGRQFSYRTFSYDRGDNSLIIWGRDADNKVIIAKYLIDEDVWAWVTDQAQSPLLVNTGNGSWPRTTQVNSRVMGGKVGWRDYTGNLYQLDTGTGVVDFRVPYSGPSTSTTQHWDHESNSLYTGPVRIYFRSAGEGVTVASIVEDLFKKTGVLQPSDYDVSALQDRTVKGYVISRDASAKDCLSQLAGAYFFDGVESDFIIKIRTRGGSPVGNISESYLGFVENRDITVKETRTQELELPMRVAITYSNQLRDYQEATQTAKRNTNPIATMFSRKEDKYELPIVLDATEAKQIADKTLKMQWTNRTSIQNVYPWEMVKYDPGDVVTVTMDNGTVHTIRFTKMDLGVDFSIKAESVTDLASAYVSSAVGDDGVIPEQVAGEATPSQLFLLNTPLLRDVDDTKGVASIMYIAAAPETPGTFRSVYVLESDDTLEYENRLAISSEVEQGFCLSVLPNTSSWAVVDEDTSLTISLEDNEASLETISDDAFLAGGNAAMIGNEVIQFRDAVLESNGKWTISHILRARRGTNYAVNNHVVGERFILLDPSRVFLLTHSPADWDKVVYFKPVPPGWLEEDVTTSYGIDLEPNDLKPYTPEDIRVSQADDDVTVKYARRSRITQELKDSSGEIGYAEGHMTPNCVYQVFLDKTLADANTLDSLTADFSGEVLHTNPSEFVFQPGAATEAVIRIREMGYVPGFWKIVEIKQPCPDQWDITELY